MVAARILSFRHSYTDWVCPNRRFPGPLNRSLLILRANARIRAELWRAFCRLGGATYVLDNMHECLLLP